MATNVTNEINNMQTQSNIYQNGMGSGLTGEAQKMDKNMFLKLMMEQLKYQDPLEPMSNTDFLAQQAQFTQVEAMESLNSNISQNNFIMQTLALVGKEVTLVDPEDPKKTISGIVTEASFDAQGSSLKVNGKDYPLALVISVKQPGTEPPVTPEHPIVKPGEGEGDKDKEDDKEDEKKV